MVLKRDQVAIEVVAVAGVVDQLVAHEGEIGTSEEVESLVDSFFLQAEALFCYLWVEVVKGVMQPKLHL